MDLTVVVPTYQRPAALAETLRALTSAKSPLGGFEIVVVDDGSGDDTEAVVRSVAADAPIEVRYHGQQNRGVASARNAGARTGSSRYLLFLDDDMVVADDHLLRHLAVHETSGPSWVNSRWEFAPAVRAELEATSFGRFRLELEDWVKTGVTTEPRPDGRLTPSAITACDLSVPREQFWRLGGFDESFPAAGAEDQELSLRAQASGDQLLLDPSIVVLHNDQRLDLRRFCERQRQGARTAAHLLAKHPDAVGDRPFLVENGPFRRGDPVPRIAKKVLKSVLGTAPALAVLHRTIGVIESARPESKLLPRLYWFMTGIYIHKGVRDGAGSEDRLPGSRPVAQAASAQPVDAEE